MQNVVQLRREAKARQAQLDALAPKVGEMAPDFELRDVNGQNPVRLSAFRGQKPVALIFGSFT
jgi:peroxiredoxin